MQVSQSLQHKMWRNNDQSMGWWKHNVSPFQKITSFLITGFGRTYRLKCIKRHMMTVKKRMHQHTMVFRTHACDTKVFGINSYLVSIDQCITKKRHKICMCSSSTGQVQKWFREILHDNTWYLDWETLRTIWLNPINIIQYTQHSPAKSK